MLIVRIEGATRNLGKPKDWSEDQACLELPIRDMNLEDGSPVMASAWQPTADELEQLKLGGHVFLWVWGRGHPPVALTVGEGHGVKGLMWRGPGGALISDREVPGVTQRLDESTAKFYGGDYMVGETITMSAAKVIAAALGFAYSDRGDA